jgi:hypothetical protein
LQFLVTHTVRGTTFSLTQNHISEFLFLMWYQVGYQVYQDILIELLAVLLLLQSHIHISSCSSLHSSNRKKDS